MIRFVLAVGALVMVFVVGYKFGEVAEWRRSRGELARKFWSVANDELRGQGMMVMALGYKVFGRVTWDRARAGVDEHGREVSS